MRVFNGAPAARVPFNTHQRGVQLCDLRGAFWVGGAVVLPRSVSRERRVSEWTLGSRDVMEEAAAFITDGQSCKDSISAAPQHLASARKWQIHAGMQ